MRQPDEAPRRTLDAIDDMTPDWLGAALGAPVTSFTATQVGTGQMGRVYRIAPTYADAASVPADLDRPASVVLKLASTDEASRQAGAATRAYEVEVNFYNEIQRRVSIRTPQCHYAARDAATNAFCLLLEDLAPAEQGDQLAGCTPDVAAAALAQLVGLHAPTWGAPDLDGIEWLNRFQPAVLEMVLAGLRTQFLERFSDDLGAQLAAVAADAIDAIGAYVHRRIPVRSVQHGDYRLDNLLLGGDAESAQVCVVDWQTVAHAAPLGDVAFFCAGAFDPEVRRANEDALVRDYHARLVAAGVAQTWDDCWRDYRVGAYHGVPLMVVSSLLVERTTRGDAMFTQLIRRVFTHVDDLATLSAIQEAQQ